MKKKPSAAERAFAMMVNAAIRCTRIRTPELKDACRLVLINEKPQSDAARACGVTRQDVYRALKAVRPKLAEIQKYVEQQCSELEERP